MWLSSTAQQAIHAVLVVAVSAGDEPVRVDEIATAIGCPRNYLSKTLHLLARAGVLRSERGPRGGFQLATPPERLTLARVVAPFEPVGDRRCLIGRPTCNAKNACPVHDRWKDVAGHVDHFFAKTTIASLLQGNTLASAFARKAMQSARFSNPKRSHGSVA
jgi:Rrf2 family protein